MGGIPVAPTPLPCSPPSTAATVASPHPAHTGLGTLHAALWYICSHRDCLFPVVCQPKDAHRLPLGRPEAHGVLGICTNWR